MTIPVILDVSLKHWLDPSISFEDNVRTLQNDGSADALSFTYGNQILSWSIPNGSQGVGEMITFLLSGSVEGPERPPAQYSFPGTVLQ